MLNLSTAEEQLVTRVVAGVLRELGHGAEPPTAGTVLDPEAWISDPNARKLLYGDCARPTFWQLMHRPDAPPGKRVTRSMIRRVKDHQAFIAAHPDR
jgi:hypothetical protein